MTYQNLEGVPQSAESPDVFSTTKLFLNPVENLDPTNPKVIEAVKFWEKRHPGGQYFLAYENGKSAVCVGRVPYAIPMSVHVWFPEPAESGATSTLIDSSPLQAVRPDLARGVRVLHYVSGSFQKWWSK